MLQLCFIFSWHENNVIHSLKALSVVGNISQYKRDVIPLPVEKQVKAFTSSSIEIRDGIQLK